jgi:hypothetical protein
MSAVDAPSHEPNTPAVHVTAMHAPGTPPIVPSTSQYGYEGSVHVDCVHVAAGLGFVHAANANGTNQEIERMDR